MRIDKVHIITRFKNLEDFIVNIDESAMETVLLGLNATGKSNFLEALVVIFRDLDLIYNYHRKIVPSFDYNIKYECRGANIEVNCLNKKFSFKVNDVVKTSEVTKNIDQFLPKHVFIYYSGISDRLRDLYIPHQKLYYDQIIKKDATPEKFDTIRRIFLVQNIHANFALIAFYMFPDQSEETLKFLREELNITEFGSALFMLKQPVWSKSTKIKDVFWGAKGLVRKLLDDLMEYSFAPIEEKAKINVSYKQMETQNRLYLFIKNFNDLKKLVDTNYQNKIELFNALESIHISDLLHDVKIRVGKRFVDGELAMSELSEGEKQLLTVLGLLKFTKDDESLILLDEPDTHLNPLWKWKYLDYLDKVVKRHSTTQIIFCSHDPLVIGNLKKNQVQIFKKDSEGKTEAFNPFISPREMSVSKILTSELFGIPSIMSKKLEDLLNEKRFLQSKLVKGDITEIERVTFERLRRYFDGIGFNDETVDSRYNLFLKLTSEREEFANRKYSAEEERDLDRIAQEILDEILSKEKSDRGNETH